MSNTGAGSTKSLNDYAAYVGESGGETCLFLRVPLSRCGDIVNVQRGGVVFNVADLASWPLDVAQDGTVRGRKFQFNGMEIAGQPKSRVTVTVAVKDDKKEVAAVISDEQMERMADVQARAMLRAMGINPAKVADAAGALAEIGATAQALNPLHGNAGTIGAETTVAGTTIATVTAGASGAEITAARGRNARK